MHTSEIYNSAIQYLSRREYGYQELLVKLQKKYPDHAAEQFILILDQLKEAGYQNDSRYAEQIIRAKINGHYGWGYIKQYLKQRGVSSDDVESGLDELSPDWFELAQIAYQKKYRDIPLIDFKDLQKRKAFMLRKGFSFDEVGGLFE